MSTNLDGVFLTIKAVEKPMREAGYGRIVNIASNVDPRRHAEPRPLRRVEGRRRGRSRARRARARQVRDHGQLGGAGLTATEGVLASPHAEAFDFVQMLQAIPRRARGERHRAGGRIPRLGGGGLGDRADDRRRRRPHAQLMARFDVTSSGSDPRGVGLRAVARVLSRHARPRGHGDVRRSAVRDARRRGRADLARRAGPSGRGPAGGRAGRAGRPGARVRRARARGRGCCGRARAARGGGGPRSSPSRTRRRGAGCASSASTPTATWSRSSSRHEGGRPRTGRRRPRRRRRGPRASSARRRGRRGAGHRDLRRRPASRTTADAGVRGRHDPRPRVRRRRRRGRLGRARRCRSATASSAAACSRTARARTAARAVRRSVSSRALFGYSGVYRRLDGGQAELVRVPNADRCLWPLPDSVSDEAAVFVADILPTGFNAVERGGSVPGDDRGRARLRPGRADGRAVRRRRARGG